MESALAELKENNKTVSRLKFACIILSVPIIGLSLSAILIILFQPLLSDDFLLYGALIMMGIQAIVLLMFLLSCLLKNEKKQQIAFKTALALAVVNTLIASAVFYIENVFDHLILSTICVPLSILILIFHLKKRKLKILFLVEGALVLAFSLVRSIEYYVWFIGIKDLLILLPPLLIKLFAHLYLRKTNNTRLAEQSNLVMSDVHG